jgi:ribose 5-phosphate isomerase B
MKETIVIGSDHAGFMLKEKLKPYLVKSGFNVLDLGPYSEERCNYPDFAAAVARAISKGKFKRGMLICKTGIGNSIVANRFAGVRAALVYNAKAAKLSREHNDSNILVLGSAFVNKKTGEKILNVWLKTGFQGGRHKTRLNLIKKIEKGIGRYL